MSISISTHVLDVERGRPASGVRVELWQEDLVTAGETDGDGRIAELAAELEPGVYRLALPPAVTVLPQRRHRGRARRGPLPRPAARLLLLVRDLPRQLSVDELAELFEGRTRFVEKLAERDDPLADAHEVIHGLTEEEKLEALNAHPAIGAKTLSRRSAAEQGADDDPETLAELERFNREYEQPLRLSLRRLREPPAEERDRARPARATRRARATRSSTRRFRSSSRSRRTGGVAPSLRRVRDRLAEPPRPLAARHRRDRLDRLVLLLHRARQPPATAEGSRATPSEGVGGETWEIHGGGFYNVKKYLVAPRVLPETLHWFKWEAYTTWLSGFALMIVLYYLERGHVSDRPERRRPLRRRGGGDQRRPAGRGLDRLRRALPSAGSRAARPALRSCSR